MTKVPSYTDLPHDFHLLPGERLIAEKTIHHPRRYFDTIPSSLEQLMRLTGSKSPRYIGEKGPSIAALTRESLRKRKRLPGLMSWRSPGDTPPPPEHLRLYEVVFGRDSLRVAIDLISSYPELARSTTLRLAQLQGVEYNQEREEEPGRILHEARDKNDARAQEISEQLGWGWPYYGSVDATPEFVRTLAAYCRRSEENYQFLSTSFVDRAGERRDMAYALDMALAWIINRLDSNDDGLLEYQSVLPQGIENQVWKDSPDAYHHADGTIANHTRGIASIEVQVTAYDALLDAAELYEHAYDDPVQADKFRHRAEQLGETILQVFWTEDKDGYFVLGTDRDDDGRLRQLKLRTSNMGHVLNSRLLEGDDPELLHKREAVIRHILSPEMLNISGIRTLATDEIRFRPGAYHNGSVWLWDTHHIAKGLRRHGHTDAANELDRRMLHVVEVTKLFPEYVRGGNDLLPQINEYTIVAWDDTMNREMTVEQPPQEVQAWTVAAILAIKKRIDREGRESQGALANLSERLQKAAKLPRELSSQLTVEPLKKRLRNYRRKSK